MGVKKGERMNTATLIGRVTRDPEVRYTPGGLAIASFTLAVDRPKKKGEEREADFIPCTAIGNLAEVMGSYSYKGQLIGILGTIRTGSYTGKDGKKVYTVEITAQRIEFLERKQTEKPAPMPERKPLADDNDIPFY